MVLVPQMDGTVKKFPESAYEEAFLACLARLRGGVDISPHHSLEAAVRNSSDPAWRESFFGGRELSGEDVIEPPEDLSEDSATEGGGGLG